MRTRRWLSVAVLLLGGVLAVSALAAAGVLYLLGWLLDILLVAIPRWIASRYFYDFVGKVITYLLFPLLVTYAVYRLATYFLAISRGDAATTRAIRAAAPKDCQLRILDLAGATTLPVLAAVISLASACVSNDSGAMHLAAATGVPVVGIFGSTNEKATSPLAHVGVPTEVLTNPVWCRPCMLRECPIDHRCMTGIEPVRVLAAVDRVAKVTA